MHWLRYKIGLLFRRRPFAGKDDTKKGEFEWLIRAIRGSLGVLVEMEDPSANPQVAFQPVMCQHCNQCAMVKLFVLWLQLHNGRQVQNQMAYKQMV